VIKKKLLHQVIGGWRRHLWDIAQKIRLFTWLIIENKILTWDTLQRKGWEGPSIFHLCSNEAEYVVHIFVKCSFIQNVWNRIKGGLNINIVWKGSTITTCYENWVTKERTHITLPFLVCWYVWLERNKRIFEDRNPSIFSVVYKILGNLANLTVFQKKAIPRNVHIPRYFIPTVGWFDGATQINGHKSGAGGLIRLSGNTVHKLTYNCRPRTNTRA
jgi:hypothetical protein